MTDTPCPIRLRPALAGVPAYVAGRPAPVIPGLETFKLSSNENPFPPLPSVLGIIAEAAGRVNRYPDMNNVELIEAIARFVGVRPTQVAVGPGSVGVLAQIITATCDPGDEVVFAWRSFEAYPILTQLAGADPVMVPLTANLEHDLPAMAAAITPRTRVVLLCTPNNPTGPALRHADVEAFVAGVPSDVAVVIDEAYLEFVSDPAVVDSLPLQRRFPNVIVLRTFSKAYGLAGLRVGYAVAHPTMAEALAKTALPFGVNIVAQAAAVGSLGVADELDERVRIIVSERKRVVAALTRLGWTLPATQANFVYFPLGVESAAFAAACEASGLVVRRYGDDGVRITIGEPAANDRFLTVAEAYLSARRSPHR
ncbi:MAG: histidinol-phosphate transaminase [Propionibacteriaceae bacterium]|nr:histidinol-phosphate transaminase [Micropruina sp.]HBX79954.1 histidinol-phosphate transaminase [Propionibacteriaceae bacterium]HBY22370.1 histidinol-phosphate transaminase [Propionibacteriaceae bacterium]